MPKTKYVCKIKYEVRYQFDKCFSGCFATYTDKAEAIKTAKFQSKHENNRLYFVKEIKSTIIFKT
jgi:hypothetical protein